MYSYPFPFLAHTQTSVPILLNGRNFAWVEGTFYFDRNRQGSRTDTSSGFFLLSHVYAKNSMRFLKGQTSSYPAARHILSNTDFCRGFMPWEERVDPALALISLHNAGRENIVVLFTSTHPHSNNSPFTVNCFSFHRVILCPYSSCSVLIAWPSCCFT